MTRTKVMPFVALEGSTLLSGLGNGVAMVAIPWLVLDLTGSAGRRWHCRPRHRLAAALSSLFSGTIVDRLGRRRTSVVSDLFSAASVAAIPLVDLTIGLTFTWVLVLASSVRSSTQRASPRASRCSPASHKQPGCASRRSTAFTRPFGASRSWSGPVWALC